MLQITIPERDFYDERTCEFIRTKGQTLQLEHSLISISRWEQKWKKPFLGREEKTVAEFSDYIRLMTLTQNVDPLVYTNLPTWVFEKVSQYIDDPMTATRFSDKSTRSFNRETITAEIIYYWMIELGVPFECRKWHLNQLITLIRVCNIKRAPKKKRGNRELLNHYRTLNAERKAKTGTKG